MIGDNEQYQWFNGQRLLDRSPRSSGKPSADAILRAGDPALIPEPSSSLDLSV
jgi:hypothetical protein